MKKLITILLLFISIGLYSQTTQKSTDRNFVLYDTFELGSYMLSDSTIQCIREDITTNINSINASDSLVIKASITTSTDNTRLSKNLADELISYGYEGNNKGLSQIRNDQVSYIVEDVLLENKVYNYFNEIEQVVNFETGDSETNRYISINLSIHPIKLADNSLITIQKIYIKTDCDSLFDARKAERERIIDSFKNAGGDRTYLKRKEYKDFRKYAAEGGYDKYDEPMFTKYSNDTLTEVLYVADNEDLTKLKMNTSLLYRKKYVQKLTIGSAFILGGVAAIWKGALIHPIYRHKYEYVGDSDSDKKERIDVSDLSEKESAYYKKINKRADRKVKQRRNWYIAGGILSAVGAAFVWDAFRYRKLSVQVGSPNGIVGLKYTY